MPRSALDLVAPNDPAVERIWQALEVQAQPSYFLSWGWIANWLAALPHAERPSLAVMHDGREPSAAFFLARRRVRRNLVLQSNALYFNATGSPRHDELGITHDGLLAVPGAHRSLAHVLSLLPEDWDELHLPAIDRDAFHDLGSPSPLLATRYQVRVEREESAPFVDLAAVRTIGYEALLPAISRTQLQRARDQIGDVEVEVAADRVHALDIYGELLRLHARNHAARRQRGAFADAWVESLHRRVIHNRLPHGEIQLMRVTSAGATVGCLYNFVHRGRVLSFQTGVATLGDRSLDPACIVQAAAIDHNARAGHARYALRDERLATGANRTIWLSVQRSHAWVSIEDRARRWYEAIVRERPQLALA